jgi:hypothetical protein
MIDSDIQKNPKYYLIQSGVMVHTCKSSTKEVEAGGSYELDATLSYIRRPCLIHLLTTKTPTK